MWLICPKCYCAFTFHGNAFKIQTSFKCLRQLEKEPPSPAPCESFIMCSVKTEAVLLCQVWAILLQRSYWRSFVWHGAQWLHCVSLNEMHFYIM